MVESLYERDVRLFQQTKLDVFLTTFKPRLMLDSAPLRMLRRFVTLMLVVAPTLADAQGSPEQPAPVVPLPATRLPRTHQPRPTSAAISAADLMTRLYVFADDSMQGREAGAIGSTKATAYIANELKRIGLQPAGDSGTYFQVLPFKVRLVDSSSIITAPNVSLPFGRQWGAAPSRDVALHDQPTVYGGVLGDSSFIAPAL